MTLHRKAVAVLMLFGIAFMCTSVRAAACAICLVAMNVTPGQQLANADIAVLARAKSGGGWQFLTRIKPAGSGPVELKVQDGIRDYVPVSADIAENQAELLVRDSLGYRWTSLGTYGLNYAGWLYSLAAMAEPASDGEWQERLALVAPQMECGDPGIEEMAHGEMARAPYTAYRGLGGVFTSEALRSVIARETIKSRRSTYILLLGIYGDEDSPAWLKERVNLALANNDNTDLAALLAAELELLGPSHLEWIAGNILLKPGTSPGMIEAALLALAVHGDEDLNIPRADIVKLHRRFIHAKPPMADYVVTKLMEWNDWSLIGDYAGLLERGKIIGPAAEFAATLYVETGRDALTGKAPQK